MSSSPNGVGATPRAVRSSNLYAEGLLEAPNTARQRGLRQPGKRGRPVDAPLLDDDAQVQQLSKCLTSLIVAILRWQVR